MEENMELQEMREQLELLKAQVAKQQLINDLNVRKMAKDKVSKLKFKFWWKLAICLFGIVYCPWAFREIMGASIGFSLVTVAFLVCAFIFEIITHRDLWSSHFYSNMADFSRRMLRIKKLNALWFKWGMIFIFPWFAWFIYEVYKVSIYEYQWVAIAAGGIVGGLIGFAIGYRLYKTEQDALQELSEQVEGLQEE
ncbi:MAG: hypothetical protein J6T82_05330 [Bacteroidaceae bacterium]|nr:hypothetical protein [Bacteroidaceae bacterium]